MLLDVSKIKNEIIKWIEQIKFDTGASVVILNSSEKHLFILKDLLKNVSKIELISNNISCHLVQLDQYPIDQEKFNQQIVWLWAKEIAEKYNAIILSSFSKEDLIFSSQLKENIYFPFGDLFESEINQLEGQKKLPSVEEWALQEEEKFKILSSDNITKIPIWFSYHIDQKKIIGQLHSKYKNYLLNPVKLNYVYSRKSNS